MVFSLPINTGSQPVDDQKLKASTQIKMD